jgi:hypothetical protein
MHGETLKYVRVKFGINIIRGSLEKYLYALPSAAVLPNDSFHIETEATARQKDITGPRSLTELTRCGAEKNSPRLIKPKVCHRSAPRTKRIQSTHFIFKIHFNIIHIIVLTLVLQLRNV